jgi:hypothetical protein
VVLKVIILLGIKEPDCISLTNTLKLAIAQILKTSDSSRPTDYNQVDKMIMLLYGHASRKFWPKFY